MSDTVSIHKALQQDVLNLEDIKRILMRDSSSINQKDEEFQTPLHLALLHKRCSVAIVKLLFDYGADPNLKCCSNTTLYTAIFCEQRIEIIRTLVERGAKADEPHDSCLTVALRLNAELEVIKLLLSAGADLFRVDISGKCPIFLALEQFNVSAIGSLLDLHDVDINIAKNFMNGSLLHSAIGINGCSADFVKLLIDRGIRVNSVDEDGNTPLHVALLKPKCNLDLIHTLLSRGSLVSAKNQNGYTPLDHAMGIHCNFDVVKLILKYYLLENPNLDLECWNLGHELKKMLLGYVNDCKGELLTMNSEHVGNDRTLFEFLKTYSANQMCKNLENGYDIDQLLQIISNKRYPLYSSVISLKFKRSLLIDKLEECTIRTVVKHRRGAKFITREVLLNFDSAYAIAHFLDDDDLLRMIVVFCN